MSFYVSTAIFLLLHCDEWDRVVALPRHKFVTGATLLQLDLKVCEGHSLSTDNVKSLHQMSFLSASMLLKFRVKYIKIFLGKLL
jgi:hypothetical protein